MMTRYELRDSRIRAKRTLCTKCRAEIPVNDVLSVAQLKVAALSAQGHGPKAIARILNCSIKTITCHKSRIRGKFEITTDVQWMTFLKFFPEEIAQRVLADL